MTKTAVHIGAGNIGRGFIGWLLHRAGYSLIMADVSDALVENINNVGHWTVHEVGEGGTDHEVSGVTAINSITDAQKLASAIASADIVTCAIGASILDRIAPIISSAIEQRDASLPPLLVMACENAIRATSILKKHVEAIGDPGSKAIFADTAVDRIVPGQTQVSLDVNVEPYYEWVVELADGPDIPGATYVEDLVPFIERKLYTVNTGHLSVAWAGYNAGANTIAEALDLPEVSTFVDNIMSEISLIVQAKNGTPAEAQAAYAKKIVSRFKNRELPDTVLRVGRSPLRKLSRVDRVIGPILEAEARDLPFEHLLELVGFGLNYINEEDPEAVSLQASLQTLSDKEVVEQIFGVQESESVFATLVETVAGARKSA